MRNCFAAPAYCSSSWMGLRAGCPHHDAFYMHVEAERAEECKRAVEDAFLTAGEIIMGLPDFPLRVHAELV